MKVELKSKRKPKKADVWTTEIKVKEDSEALNKLIKLVRKYEDLS